MLVGGKGGTNVYILGNGYCLTYKTLMAVTVISTSRQKLHLYVEINLSLVFAVALLNVKVYRKCLIHLLRLM